MPKYLKPALKDTASHVVRRQEQEDGVLIVDDTIEKKPHTQESELICWHHDHQSNRSVKGVNIINYVYSVEDTSLPVGFDVIKKPIKFCAVKTRKEKRRATVTKNELTRNLFTIKSDRPLKLVELYGAGLAKLGADSDLSSTRDYALSRSWCQAIYSHPQQVDGILYMSRHDNTYAKRYPLGQLCCGLFDRKTYRLIENNLGNLLNYDRQRFFKILDRYSFGTD